MANDDNLKPFKTGYDSRRGSKPKGSKHISTRIREILADEHFTYKLPDGRDSKGAPMEAMIRAMAIKASEGDIRAFDVLVKHGYGTKVELDVTQGQPSSLTPQQAEQLLRLRAARPIDI